MANLDRDNVKILLVSFRDDDLMREADLKGLARAAKLSTDNFIVADALAEPLDPLVLTQVQAVILGGAKHSVLDNFANAAATEAFLMETRARHVPILGICFGHQLLAKTFGGEVIHDRVGEEHGSFLISLTDESFTDPLFADHPNSFYAQCSHHDRVTVLPPGAVILASSDACPIHVFTFPGEGIYGVQFHPERSKADFERILTLVGREFSGQPGRVEHVMANLRETPEAEAVVAKWIDRIVLSDGAQPVR